MPTDHRPRLFAVTAALGVHLLTASGAGLGLMALTAVFVRDDTQAFLWLGLALITDGLDGPLARLAAVRENQPFINGDSLDLVVDFLNYVIVPLMIIWQAFYAGSYPGLVMLAFIASASALYFADTRMKTSDNWFRGFPAIWNILAFYLVCFSPPQTVTTVILLGCTVLMFTPVMFVHPVRVTAYRGITLTVIILGSVAAMSALMQDMTPDNLTRTVLALCAAWILALPLFRKIPHGKNSR